MRALRVSLSLAEQALGGATPQTSLPGPGLQPWFGCGNLPWYGVGSVHNPVYEPMLPAGSPEWMNTSALLSSPPQVATAQGICTGRSLRVPSELPLLQLLSEAPMSRLLPQLLLRHLQLRLLLPRLLPRRLPPTPRPPRLLPPRLLPPRRLPTRLPVRPRPARLLPPRLLPPRRLPTRLPVRSTPPLLRLLPRTPGQRQLRRGLHFLRLLPGLGMLTQRWQLKTL